MRPSSSLFDAVLARGPVSALVSDEAWLAALLTVEAALARVQAQARLIPVAAADAIEAVGADPFDPATLGLTAAESGNPAVPPLAALPDAVGPAPPRHAHAGTTSHGILAN